MSAIADDRKPRWSEGVPVCTEDECPCFDGKRCRVMGFRPGRLCEPEVSVLVNDNIVLLDAMKDIASGDGDWEEVRIARAAIEQTAKP